MLTNFTLIIPTRNRQQYLSRGIDFYKNSSIQVIIVDSSEQKYQGEIAASNIQYFHYPGHNFVSKIQDVLKKIDTPYCGMCADDDFILPSALKACVDFLEQDASYSSAQGNYVTYRQTKKGISALPLLHPYQWEISEALPSERIIKLFDNYFHLFYSVHRTSSFKEIFYSFDATIRNLNFFEVHIAFISLINGKHKSLPIFYNAREIITGSTGQTAGNWITFLNNQPDKRDWFINLISEKTSAKEGCSIEYARKACELAIQKYLNGGKKLSVTQKIINRLVPISKQYLIKNLKIQLRYGGEDHYNLQITKGRKGYPFVEGPDKQEFEKIKTIILKYPV